MAVCPKCNTRNEDGVQFCCECGSAIPAPQSAMPSFGATAAAPMNIGDKNVISGDIIQQKTSYNIQGNIVNETVCDETKLVKECHECGKHVANNEGFTCPKCNNFVCASHYDIKAKLCKTCSSEARVNRYNEYQTLFHNLREQGNGTIGIEARKTLDEAKERLGLSDSEVESAEYLLDQGLSRIEVMEVQSGLNALLNGDPTSSLPKIEKIYKDHEGRYEATDVYLQMLKFLDRAKYKKESTRGEMSMLADIDLAIIDGDFYDAEELILKYRKIIGDLSMNKNESSSECSATEYAYLYSVLGCVYGKPELTAKSNEFLRDSATFRQSDYFSRRAEMFPNEMIIEEYWAAFRKFIGMMNDAVSCGNKDALASLSPFWRFMAKPYKGLIESEKAANGHVPSVAALGPQDAAELQSLLDSWKQQVETKRQRAEAAQDALAATAARHEEEERKRAEEAAAEEAERQAALAARNAAIEAREREREEYRLQKEAKAQARLDREAEAESRREAREQARRDREAEVEARREAREQAKAEKEAERLRKKQLEASVQPFMVLGEYEFSYIGRDGITAKHKVKQVFVTDGRHFRCVEQDGFDTIKVLLFENVRDLKHLGSGKTAENALDLFRQYETQDSNAFCPEPFGGRPASNVGNPFANPQLKNPLDVLSSSLNSLNEVAKKAQTALAESSKNRGNELTSDLMDGKKPVNKWVYILLAVFLGFIGIHKFYSGKKVKGVIYLVFFWTYIPFLIGLVEAVIAFLKPTDSDGNIWL